MRLLSLCRAGLLAAALIQLVSASPAVAGDPTGACCMVESCSQQTQFGCSQSGGSYKGNSTSCAIPNICTCGNGQEDGTEECDDGNTSNGDSCIGFCQDARCGDPFLNAGVEECEDSNTNNNDACVGCQNAECGDGFVYTDFEQCDDGNTAGGDGCTNCTIDFVSTTTSSTTTTLPAIGACCFPSGGCNELGEVLCELKVSGTWQGEGTICSEVNCGVCGDGNITQGEECDDANSLAGDGCSDDCVVEQCWQCTEKKETTTTFLIEGRLPGPSVCEPDDSATCDDGDVCTLGDTCSAGTCSGEEVLIPAACYWVMVGGDPDKNVRARSRSHALVTGHVCGDTVRIGDSVTTIGDVVAVENSGKGVFFAAGAQQSGDVITDGSSVIGKPRDTLLPGLTTDEVPGGQIVPQSVPEHVYDTTGANPRVDECVDAQDGIDEGAALVAGLPSTQDLGDTKVKGGDTLTINATNVGGLNVIDFERLRTGNQATIVLDGGGNAETVFVLRIEKKFDLRLRSQINLVNGTVPGRVVIVAGSKCKIGEDVVGGGTVLCPDGKLLMEERVVWDGALLGGVKIVQVRDSVTLTHAPLVIGQ